MHGWPVWKLPSSQTRCQELQPASPFISLGFAIESLKSQLYLKIVPSSLVIKGSFSLWWLLNYCNTEVLYCEINVIKLHSCQLYGTDTMLTSGNLTHARFLRTFPSASLKPWLQIVSFWALRKLRCPRRALPRSLLGGPYRGYWAIWKGITTEGIPAEVRKHPVT